LPTLRREHEADSERLPRHSPTAGGGRRDYLDWLRGIGVLIMIETHTLDSWTRLADRDRATYQWAIVLGGFGAPIFLFLAGVALVLAANSRRRRGLSEVEATRRAERRAWQVFGLAFLFRLQSLVISGGGMRALLKVDILNVMGVSMLTAAWLWRLGRTPWVRAAVLVAATVLVVMFTPPVRSTSWLDGLPDAIEAYIRPLPGRATFTFFPWAGFLFAGAVTGIWIDRDHGREGLWNGVLLLTGIAIAAVGYAASFLPPVYAVTSFWTSSPTFFFIRLGIIASLVPLAYVWSRVAPGLVARSPIRVMGVESLFVYWIHVEMVYGVLSTPLHKRLTFEGALAAMAAFTVFLYGLVQLKQRWFWRRAGEKSTNFASYRASPASNRPQSG
jgi:uncharacterized membrane protein